ncbi:hypothetical protein ACFXHA_06755 [Nocardia sp. NPDC059240]|uniref:DUF7373 family lipoprotein n=1 Tax=Nocardia sp. NPDC059240 TaxID=3346786 RepID=UPI0036C03E6C
MGILDGRRLACTALVCTAAAIISTVLLSGCGSTVSGTANAGEMDVRKLEVGQYSTVPLDARDDYQHDVFKGRELAAGRLMDAVVTGVEVDPTFNHSVKAKALIDSSDYGALAYTTRPVLEQNKMQFGFTASASSQPLPDHFVSGGSGYSPLGGAETNPDTTGFNVTVLQFPDQQLAQSAADQTEAVDFAMAADQNARVTLDKQPNARAHWRPGVPSMAATLATGQYVVTIFVQQTKPDLDGLKALAEKVLAAQLPLLDKVPALSQRDILRLDYDPDGMIRRTLHPKDYSTPNAQDEITRTPRGYLHFAEDQAAWKKLLDAGGVDKISDTKNGALLFRARDVAAATTLWSGINAITPVSDDKSAAVPDMSCAESPKAANPNDQTAWSTDAWNHNSRFVCTVHYDRYVARVASSQLADAHLRAAAQYALLANSQFM